MDKVQHCETYGVDVCSETTHQQWAYENCKRYCGYCGQLICLFFTLIVVIVICHNLCLRKLQSNIYVTKDLYMYILFELFSEYI